MEEQASQEAGEVGETDGGSTALMVAGVTDGDSTAPMVAGGTAGETDGDGMDSTAEPGEDGVPDHGVVPGITDGVLTAPPGEDGVLIHGVDGALYYK